MEGLRKHIENSIRVGEAFRDMVMGRGDLFEIIAEPRFALTCLRVRPGIVAARTDGGTGDEVYMNGDASRPHPSGESVSSRAEETEGECTIKVDAQSNLSDHEEVGQLEAQAETLANTVTKDIADLINSRGEIFITASTTAGKTFIRVVSGSPSSSEEIAKRAFEIIVKATEEMLDRWGRGERLKK